MDTLPMYKGVKGRWFNPAALHNVETNPLSLNRPRHGRPSCEPLQASANRGCLAV